MPKIVARENSQFRSILLYLCLSTAIINPMMKQNNKIGAMRAILFVKARLI